MNLAALSSSSASWWLAELIVSVVAASGGIIVFWGLWWEGYGGKEEYRDIVDFRSSKRKAKSGAKILLFGIGVEIIVAVALAAWDGWEIRQASANTPAKMPVSSIEATADFFVETNLDDPGTIYGSPGDSAAFLVLSEKPNVPPSTNDLHVNMTCDVAQCRLYMTHPGTPENRWMMTLHFVMEPTDEYFSAKSLSRPAEELQKKLNFFAIYPKFLYGNTVEFFNGKVNFVLNGSISKTLVLPKQKVDLNPTRVFQSTPSAVAAIADRNGIVEYKTNAANLTNSASGPPAKWFFSNF